MSKSSKIALIVGGVILAGFAIVPTVMGSFFWGQGTGWGMMGTGMMGGFGAMGFMSIFWIFILGLIIWAVVAVVRGTGQRGRFDSTNRPDSAMEILKKKYASGEIDSTEFEEKKRNLL